MATMLENYQELRNAMEKQESPLTTAQIWQYQELIYRIGVLETCQLYAKIAPVTDNINQMVTHYQLVDAYFQCLTQERRYGMAPDEKTQKQRDTSHQNLCRVMEDYRKRLASFAPGSHEQYKKEIGGVIGTFLPVWAAYRNTYITIMKTKEDAA